MSVSWTTTALRRLDGFAEQIRRDDPERALVWVDEVFASVARLEQFPESGRIVPEVDKPHIREILLGSYRIIYSIRGRRVFVRTPRHVRQKFSMR